MVLLLTSTVLASSPLPAPREAQKTQQCLYCSSVDGDLNRNVYVCVCAYKPKEVWENTGLKEMDPMDHRCTLQI